jgi:hypothetical protein
MIAAAAGLAGNEGCVGSEDVFIVLDVLMLVSPAESEFALASMAAEAAS